jgi:hypothetical protein
MRSSSRGEAFEPAVIRRDISRRAVLTERLFYELLGRGFGAEREAGAADGFVGVGGFVAESRQREHGVADA